MATRLSDIAAQAGVSEATVSRVLNGKPNVSTVTRQSVLTALDVLGYERPPRLRPQRAGLIGLIVPELTNPVFPVFAQVIETALATSGYTAVLCTQTPGGIREDDYTDLLLERGVAGIIVVSGMHADSTATLDRYTRLTDRGLPLVLVNGYREGVDAPFISNDDGASIELGVEHLISLGHTRIGLALGQERFVPSIRKAEGFRRALAAGLGMDAAAADELITPSLFTVEGGQAAASRLLDQGCTAICCGSDILAIGVIRAARQRGLRVPEDVSVVGFDDSPLVPYLDPPLTTIRQPVREMSMTAVGYLLEELGGNRVPRGELLYRPELVVRRSTGPVARTGPVDGG
ncbi:LacI family DNA-binding transcriptional regulator [Actinocorallia populi]|uniref:LacI family DNA-binding transcriptional regulator n=1 Tax=Actinocorallia populi TaxID=2079200 RepID=UPI000D08B746|nr:LacI family DNA-binding transcriptional regulator [Actinocorallia populi]